MENKFMYTVGNLGQGYAWGVEATHPFDSTEIHGPFSTENEANRYMHELAENDTADYPVYVGIKIVRIETPQAGKRIVRSYVDGKQAPGVNNSGWEYAV